MLETLVKLLVLVLSYSENLKDRVNQQRRLNYEKYIVYKTTLKLDDRIYIGVHGQEDQDNYLGSGKHLKRALEYYGSANFEREILFTYDDEDQAYDKEAELVTEEFVKLDTNFNITPGGNKPPRATEDSTEKSAQTRLELYGSRAGALSLLSTKNKVRKTIIEKYGKLAGQMHTSEAINKARITRTAKYGSSNASLISREATEKSKLARELNTYNKYIKELKYFTKEIYLVEIGTTNTWQGNLNQLKYDLSISESLYGDLKLISRVHDKLLKGKDSIKFNHKKYSIILKHNLITFND